MPNKNTEFDNFNVAMGAILRADPDKVKAAMDAEKRARAMEAERTGKRGRGRPPKQSSASDRVSSEMD